MIPPLTLAQICADVYTPAPTGFDHVWDYAGCHAAHKKVGDVDVIVYRGSLDTMDWMLDAAAIPLWDPRLGFVHGGFMAGVNDTFIAASLVCGPKVVVTGHSLGGARARLHAGLLAHYGTPALQVCVFGSPKPGFAGLARILQKSGTLLQSFRNCEDPVSLVAMLLPWWVHPDPWIALNEHSAPGDLEPLRDHHMLRYQGGLTTLDALKRGATEADIAAGANTGP